MNLVSKILTLGERKKLKVYEEKAARINEIEPSMLALSDAELAALTPVFRKRHMSGESLESLLPEAFAAVREASLRAIGLRHFDVQLIGGMVLHDGQIAEMRTGEGKTLVSVLAGYLNAIGAGNVHMVTANDYLARRDCEQMGNIYRFLGMTTGLIQSGMELVDRKSAYQANVTYGTSSEFGFDYLRDNMVTSAQHRVQRGHRFAIVDEVDSILIDEARTPLIISGGGESSAEMFRRFASAMPSLREGDDFERDEAKRVIATTEAGLLKVERLAGVDDIYTDASGMLANYLQQALRAQFLFHRDVDYVVADGEVKIVDEFTGRIMEGRRYSDGLHQAIEAKEGVEVREESQTLASITLQNYFRLYGKLSGMTGTAMTEEAEFRQIYGLSVVAIPPNKPLARKDEADLVYRTREEKLEAVIDDVVSRHAKGQPVLVGTASIEGSERLSYLLSKRGIRHEVLNAKNHEHEASIVAQAGRIGAVTIATNMAGRGTDILLGGNPEILARQILWKKGLNPEASVLNEDGNPNPVFPNERRRTEALEEAKAICSREQKEVLALGGLRVVGTERHDSRRIDNQLRGRAGRQGDPGSSQFFISLEDDLMQKFGSSKMESIMKLMQKAGISKGEPIQAPAATRAIEGAQRQVEAMHFSARKTLLEYDDVMNRQRAAVYAERHAILDGKDLTDSIPRIIEDATKAVVAENCSANGNWNVRAIEFWMAGMTGRDGFRVDALDYHNDPDNLAEALTCHLQAVYDRKQSQLSKPLMRSLASQFMMRAIDARWVSHLREMDTLKTGISLRAIGRRDPMVEYKEEAYAAFSCLTKSMYEDCLRSILRFRLVIKLNVDEKEASIA